MTLANKVHEFNEQIVPVARQIVHGGPDTLVETDGGKVRSFAKVLKDFAGTVASTIGFQYEDGTVRTIGEKLEEISISAHDFGVLGDGSDETAKVQKAINAALKRGVLRVRLDTDCYCPGNLVNRSRVVFVGAGALTGNGAYRRHVLRENDPTTPARFGTLVPHRHLRKFSSSRRPTIVLVGSSTGSWQPNSPDAVSTLPYILSTRLSQFNPDKQLIFHNRAIGGQTFGTLNAVPSSFPTWYVDQAKPWLDYVKDLAPDTIFIVMGSNDQKSIAQETLVAVVNKIKAFPKVPDIIFITQPSVCLDPHPNYASFGNKADQEGRDFAAGIVRSFAQYEGYGLIDGNRMGGIVLDGRDLLDTASRRLVSNLPLPSGEYVATVPCHDFALRLRFNGNAAAIAAAFPLSGPSPNPLCVRVGAGGGGGPWSGDVIFIMRDDLGKFRFELYSRGIGLYRTINSDADFPTASFSLDIAKVGNEVTVSVSGSEDTMRFSFPIKVHGGEFLPRVGHYALNSGPFQTLEHYNLGEPKRYIPALTGVEAWGAPNSNAGTSLPYGGNGVNHFSSIGTRAIYGALLDEMSLTAAHADSGRYTPTFPYAANLTSYSVDADACMWKRVGNFVTVMGKVTVVGKAVGLATLDISLPIPTDFPTSNNVTGVVNATAVGGMTGAFFGNDGTDTARMQLSITNTASQNVRFYFTYEIR